MGPRRELPNVNRLQGLAPNRVTDQFTKLNRRRDESRSATLVLDLGSRTLATTAHRGPTRCACARRDPMAGGASERGARSSLRAARLPTGRCRGNELVLDQFYVAECDQIACFRR
jgi:hypothetical protein